MTCYNPIPACYSKAGFAKTGRKDIHLVLHEDTHDKYLLNEKNFPHALYEYIKVPCKKCVGCRSDNARMWTLRAFHELKLHKYNCFITLTYDNNSEVVYDDPLCIASLRYKHFQNFMKRLRKRFPNDKIGYIVCGEYGLKDGRAHWHAILFGFDFPDKELIYVKNGYNHYYSQILQDCWSTYIKERDYYEPIGFIDLCDVDLDCCKYVAGYVLKKLPVDNKGATVGHYLDDNGNLQDIELVGVAPPIIRTSRNPSIGLKWFEKYGKNSVENGFCYQPDKLHTSVQKIKTPSYYNYKFEKLYPEEYQIIKKRKEEKMKEYYSEHSLSKSELQSMSDSHLYRIKKKLKDTLSKIPFYKKDLTL